MTLRSRRLVRPHVVDFSTPRESIRLRAWLHVLAIGGVLALCVSPSSAGASAIAPKTFCAKISAATVSTLFGQKVSLLGALAQGSGNDVCEFAKFVSGSVSGVTLNYDYKATGSVASNLAALKKEKGVTDLVLTPHSSIGGTTYSFTDTFSDATLHTKIKESGMDSFNGSNHYGAIATKVLPTSTLAKLLTLVVHAA